MSTYSTTTTHTDVTDKRQVAEGEYIAGPDSILSLPYSVALGPGAKLSMTGADADKIVGQLLTNMDSTVAQSLGVMSQMAQGIFEKTTIAGGVPAAVVTETSRNMLYLVAGGVVLMMILLKR